MIDENVLIEDLKVLEEKEYQKSVQMKERDCIDLVAIYAKGEKCYRNAIETVKSQPKTDNWIPCSERLPEEKINPITKDYYTYPVTFQYDGITDIRYYGFGRGHWRHGLQIMDECVTAWFEMPEPYREPENAAGKEQEG